MKFTWFDLPNHNPNIQLDAFVVMPNHIHGIIIINDDVGAIHESPTTNEYTKQRRLMTLPKIIGCFKMNSAKQINQLRQTPGIPVWLRNYYEHVIRNEYELTQISEYIQNNSLQWHLDRENPQRSGDDLLEAEIFGKGMN